MIFTWNDSHKKIFGRFFLNILSKSAILFNFSNISLPNHQLTHLFSNLVLCKNYLWKYLKKIFSCLDTSDKKRAFSRFRRFVRSLTTHCCCRSIKLPYIKLYCDVYVKRLSDTSGIMSCVFFLLTIIICTTMLTRMSEALKLILLYRWLSYLPNPSARAGYDTRSILKRSLTGFNSEFSF